MAKSPVQVDIADSLQCSVVNIENFQLPGGQLVYTRQLIMRNKMGRKKLMMFRGERRYRN